MIDPKEFTQRDAINSLTGIKSSLGNLRKVVSLTYLLYLANKKKSSIVYAESKEGKIVLKKEYKTFIQQFLNNSEIIEKIDDNPLLTSQIESLYVGLTLMFAFGRIGFENSSLSMTKERTGGIRYPKKIDFASNIITLDLMLSSDSEASVKEILLAWLQDKQLDNQIEQRISIFLNICIENNLFKLRHGEDDLYFQTEGIYKSLMTGNEVSLQSDEIVGPTRILNSMLRENLVPWLNFKKSLLTVNENNDFDVKEYSDIVTTSLNIRDIKVDNTVVNLPKEEENDREEKKLPLQQITFGAPGTGKSHGIKKETAGKSVIRTTFHPDSDYSTFVGAYKPVMEETDVRVLPVVLNEGASFDENKGTLKEKRISYKFVKQAFLKAYLGAWKKYAEAEGNAEPQFLVIEEINRGNCAQIFGDLFQLLDRNDENDFSTYPIDADTDLQKEIEKAFKEEMDGESENPYRLFKDIDVEGVVEDYTSNYGASLSNDIQEGRVLLLPPNLYIWATMNTSDQSLFPIDSAFKRRWAWDYVKITDGKKDWMIQGKDYSCDWWMFIQEINKKIATATSSDDKKLGYYFCKAKNNTTRIDEKIFVSKVIFYLWNDVFKDNDNTIFKVSESSGEPSFDDFYEEINGEIVPNSSAVKKFLINVVGVENVYTIQSQIEETELTDQVVEQDS